MLVEELVALRVVILTYNNQFSYVNPIHTFFGNLSVAILLGLAREDNISILNPTYKALMRTAADLPESLKKTVGCGRDSVV